MITIKKKRNDLKRTDLMPIYNGIKCINSIKCIIKYSRQQSVMITVAGSRII